MDQTETTANNNNREMEVIASLTPAMFDDENKRIIKNNVVKDNQVIDSVFSPSELEDLRSPKTSILPTKGPRNIPLKEIVLGLEKLDAKLHEEFSDAGQLTFLFRDYMK